MTGLYGAAQPRRVCVAVIGFGRVGREVVARIVARRQTHASRAGVRLEITLLADRSGVLFDPAGMTEAFLGTVTKAKAAGSPLADLAGNIALQATRFDPAWLPTGGALQAADVDIAVDTTAADTTDLLIAVRRQGAALVLANKLPLSGPMASWDALTGPAGPPALWGTTVASSLPVAAVVRALADAGDPPTRMIGCLSGTLGVLLAGIAAGSKPSDVLADAIATGLAEPDPRRDLDGRDLAAKALILARTAGFRLESHDVTRTPLVKGLDGAAAPLAEISERLDGVAGELRNAMAASDNRLRYLAEVTESGASVGLGVAPDDVAAAAPTNSAVRIETAGFRVHPLFLSGRGGGAAATAEGVIADLIMACRRLPLSN